MNPSEANNREAKRQALLGQLHAAEAALRANLDVDCADVTARVHMQRALAHIQEATVAVHGVGRARTVWQLVDDLTKLKRDSDDLQQESPCRSAIKLRH
ncbi:MAG TPA: hypothetical protein VN887_15885 [Candidatus Angelobacter sp.]|nr:hypothetical protein [Candidatus Angelobacter sp.]